MTRNKEANILLKLAHRDKVACEVLIHSPKAALSTACFHAQQVAEKAIKAVLTNHGIVFKRTHDLIELYGLLEKHSVEIPFERDLLERLNPYAVIFRYDDSEIELVKRKEVIQFVNSVYTWAKKEIK